MLCSHVSHFLISICTYPFTPNLRDQSWWLSYERHQTQGEEQRQEELQGQKEEPWWHRKTTPKTKSWWTHGQFFFLKMLVHSGCVFNFCCYKHSFKSYCSKVWSHRVQKFKDFLTPDFEHTLAKLWSVSVYPYFSVNINPFVSGVQQRAGEWVW